MTEKTTQEPLRQVCIAGNDKYRKYIYLEDGVVVEEKFFEIVDGLEIPSEEPNEKKQIIRLPENLEGADKLQVLDPETWIVAKFEILTRSRNSILVSHF